MGIALLLKPGSSRWARIILVMVALVVEDEPPPRIETGDLLPRSCSARFAAARARGGRRRPCSAEAG